VGNDIYLHYIFYIHMQKLVDYLFRLIAYPAVLFIILLNVIRFIVVFSFRYFKYGMEVLIHKQFDKETVRELLDVLKNFNDKLNEDSKTALDREINSGTI
jgi:flagellar motor component MotA